MNLERSLFNMKDWTESMGQLVLALVGKSIRKSTDICISIHPHHHDTGDTKAIASISGPIEVRIAAEQPSRLTFEVILRPLSNVPGTESKSLSSTLRSLLIPSLILTRNPRTLVQLVVQSLVPIEVGGQGNLRTSSLVSALINASTLALLSAGNIPMCGVVCAVAVGRISVKSSTCTTLILDPSEEEIPSLEASGCFAFLFAAGPNGRALENVPSSEVVWNNWQSTTSFSEEELLRAQDLARDGAEHVWVSMKQSIGSMGAPSHMHGFKASRKSEIADIGTMKNVMEDDVMEL